MELSSAFPIYYAFIIAVSNEKIKGKKTGTHILCKMVKMYNQRKKHVKNLLILFAFLEDCGIIKTILEQDFLITNNKG